MHFDTGGASTHALGDFVMDLKHMVCDHKERGVSTFHHDRYQMGHVFEMLISPHITDWSTRVYYENLDRGIAEPEELARAFSLLVKLGKSFKTPIFHRHMRDSDFETLPWQLSAGDTMYYNCAWKEEDKAVV